MTELEGKEQRQKSRDVWSHRKFMLTSSSSWIIPSVVNGFTKMKTTVALRMARPKCHQYSHLAAKARDNGNSPLPTQNGPVLPFKELGPPKAWHKVSALLYNTVLSFNYLPSIIGGKAREWKALVEVHITQAPWRNLTPSTNEGTDFPNSSGCSIELTPNSCRTCLTRQKT